MWQYLRQHPDIYMPPEKEPHFFGSDLRFQSSIVRSKVPLEEEQFVSFPPWHYPRADEDRIRYASSFANAGNVKRVGEASTWYLYSQKAALEIKDFNPEASIIIMLRNPVDMLLSLHTLYVFLGIERIGDFGEAMRACEVRESKVSVPQEGTIVSDFMYQDSARYADQVERYLDVFGESSIHVIIYDDFKRDVARTYRDALRFLDVEPDFQPEFRVVDPSIHARFKAVQSFEVRYGQLIKRLLLSVPGPVSPILLRALGHLKKLNHRVGQVSSTDPDLRRQLQHEFAPDVERLSQLLNRDLTHWVRE